jgi:hypothetical protein
MMLPPLARLWRLVVALLGMALLAGCFASDTPAITPRTAQDVGPTLAYSAYSAYGGSYLGVRLRRGEEKSYSLEIYDLGGDPFSTMRMADGVLVRQIARRGDTPIYAIQIDTTELRPDPDLTPQALGFRYLTFLVAVDPSGLGTVAVTSCQRQLARQDPSLGPLMATHGLAPACPGGEGDDVLTRIAGRPASADYWAFLTDLLATVALPWEDRIGVGLLDRL